MNETQKDLLAAADHIRDCNEVIAAEEKKRKERHAYYERLHAYIAQEIRLAMQQEKLEITDGVSRAAVAYIRASMIMQAIEFDVRENHVESIPKDHIERKRAQLIYQI